MSKSNYLPARYCHQHQQGGVSLQNIFWIVGIIVGLLSIAQFALPYLNGESDDSNVDIVATGDTATAQTTEALEAKKTNGNPSKRSHFDSASVKVGNYTAYDNGIVVDTDRGIMWMRCSLGQEWDGTSCIGNADTYDIEEAKEAITQLNKVSYIGLTGWQLPDIEALHSLVYCSEGFEDSAEILVHSGDTKSVQVRCTGDYAKPTIKANVFPNTHWAVWSGYWSSSRNEQNQPLAVYFNTGDIKAKNGSHYVRLMRYMN